MAALLASIAGEAGGQREDRAPFQFRDGYEEVRFGSGDVTIKTRDGVKTLHVSLAKLRVAQTAKPAASRLPGEGRLWVYNGGMVLRRTPHAVYDTFYHLVGSPKSRRDVLQGEVQQRVQELFADIAEPYDITEVALVRCQRYNAV